MADVKYTNGAFLKIFSILAENLEYSINIVSETAFRIAVSDTILIWKFAGSCKVVFCVYFWGSLVFNNFVILPKTLENHQNSYFHQNYRGFSFRRPPF